MERYKCSVCGYIYDPLKGEPEFGIDIGVEFRDLPDDFICPLCSTGKDDFFVCDESSLVFQGRNYSIIKSGF